MVLACMHGTLVATKIAALDGGPHVQFSQNTC